MTYIIVIIEARSPSPSSSSIYAAGCYPPGAVRNARIFKMQFYCACTHVRCMFFCLFYVKCMHAGQHKFSGVALKWFGMGPATHAVFLLLCVHALRLHHGNPAVKNIRDRSKTHQMASFSASPFFFLSQNNFRPDVSQKYRPDVSTKTTSTHHQCVPIRQRRERDRGWVTRSRSRLWWHPFLPSFCLVVG